MKAYKIYALQESVRVWQKKLTMTSGMLPLSHLDCPLCGLFFYRTPDCKGCPVKKDTKKSLCRKSPYDTVSNFIETLPRRKYKFFLETYSQKEMIKLRKLIKKEIDYLNSLLPPMYRVF